MKWWLDHGEAVGCVGGWLVDLDRSIVLVTTNSMYQPTVSAAPKSVSKTAQCLQEMAKP